MDNRVGRLAVLGSALSAVALIAAGKGSAQAPDPAPAADSLAVTGRIVDHESRRPLPGVLVSLLVVGGAGEEILVWRGATDASGGFETPGLPARVYQIRGQAPGFQPVREAVALLGARRAEIRIEMVPEALELDPIVVTALRRSRLEAAGFYERRRLGMGHSFTRAEIEARNPSRVSDLFRTVPGVRVLPSRRAGGATLLFRGNCQPDLVVDGTPVSHPFAIDEVLSVSDLEAVEVHSGTFQPARVGFRSCGTVLAWTREGGRTGGEPASWKRTLTMVVVATGFFLIAR